MSIARKLTHHLKTGVLTLKQADVYLDIAIKSDNAEDLEKVIKRINSISEDLLQIRIHTHNAITKGRYSKKSAQDAQNELGQLSALIESAGTEADRLTENIKIMLERHPGELLSLLADDTDKLKEAFKSLPADDQMIYESVIKTLPK